MLALVATGGFEAVLLIAALRTRGEPRAALLGLAAACGYALTAALMKQAMSALADGPAAFFSTWQLYATAAAGVGSLFLLQNALQAGTLVASQPMLTIGDALISSCFGVLLFAEDMRFGWWLVPELRTTFSTRRGRRSGLVLSFAPSARAAAVRDRSGSGRSRLRDKYLHTS